MDARLMFPSKYLKARDIPREGLDATIGTIKEGSLPDARTHESKTVYSLIFSDGVKPLTVIQLKVLNSMPTDRWVSIFELSDLVYPARFRRNVQGLRRAQVRNALNALRLNGRVITNGAGLWQRYE